jgi:serine/threonine protein kinase
MWSCGIVFTCMTIRRFPWRIPRATDPSFRAYATNHNQQQFRLLKLLPRESRSILSSILDIDPQRRASLKTVLNDKWVQSIDVCHVNQPGHHHVHHVLVPPTSNQDHLVVITPEPPGVVAEKEKKKSRPPSMPPSPRPMVKNAV